MKFRDISKYQKMNSIDDEILGIIKSNIECPCGVCGDLTPFIEINYEGYFCSEECIAEMDRQSRKLEIEYDDSNLLW